MKYELSETIVNNIKGFLLRTTLQGKEVPAYIDILNALVPINDEPNRSGSDISRNIKSRDSINR